MLSKIVFVLYEQHQKTTANQAEVVKQVSLFADIITHLYTMAC